MRIGTIKLIRDMNFLCASMPAFNRVAKDDDAGHIFIPFHNQSRKPRKDVWGKIGLTRFFWKIREVRSNLPPEFLSVILNVVLCQFSAQVECAVVLPFNCSGTRGTSTVPRRDTLTCHLLGPPASPARIGSRSVPAAAPFNVMALTTAGIPVETGTGDMEIIGHGSEHRRSEF